MVMESRLEQLVDAALAGGPHSLRAAARLMSVMTNEPQRLAEVLANGREWREPRMVLGVTGAPGSGKSTLVDHLAKEYRTRFPDRRIGIVAVDPSSPFTGGALLGDRVRMMRHATDRGVFIRSLASRGRLGGLALGTKGVVRVMGLIGCDVVIIETVGVGQSEVEIAKNADLTAVVLAPGQGDSIQMLKAGLIEAGDLFVVNKADRDDAARLHQQLLSVLELSRRVSIDAGHVMHPEAMLAGDCATSDHAANSETRPVFLCSAVNHIGVPELVNNLEMLAERHSTTWQAQRRKQAVDEIRQAVLLDVEQRISALIDNTAPGQGSIAKILAGDATICEISDELLREALHQSVRQQSQQQMTNSAARVRSTPAAIYAGAE